MRKLLLNLTLAVSISTLFTALPTYAATSSRFKTSTVSVRKPCQNAEIAYKARVVKRSTGAAVKSAGVSFKVYYKTKTTTYSAGKTDSTGKVIKKFKIGRATPNFKVVIKAKATKSSKTIATASSWFTPKKCS